MGVAKELRKDEPSRLAEVLESWTEPVSSKMPMPLTPAPQVMLPIPEKLAARREMVWLVLRFQAARVPQR